MYAKSASVYRYKHGETQLELLFDGASHYEKYKEASSVSQDESASHSEKQYQNFVASIYARKSYEIGLDIFGSDSKNISNLLDNYAHSSFKAGMYDNAIKASLLWEEFIKNK